MVRIRRASDHVSSATSGRTVVNAGSAFATAVAMSIARQVISIPSCLRSLIGIRLRACTPMAARDGMPCQTAPLPGAPMSDDLIATLSPISHFVAGLDLTDRAAAETALAEAFPAESMTAVSEALRQAHEAGTLTPRQAGPDIRFGRVAKPTDATAHHSIDAVDIAGAGAPTPTPGAR